MIKQEIGMKLGFRGKLDLVLADLCDNVGEIARDDRKQYDMLESKQNKGKGRNYRKSDGSTTACTLLSIRCMVDYILRAHPLEKSEQTY